MTWNPATVYSSSIEPVISVLFVIFLLLKCLLQSQHSNWCMFSRGSTKTVELITEFNIERLSSELVT